MNEKIIRSDTTAVALSNYILSVAPFSIHLFRLLVILSFGCALKRSDSRYLAFRYVFIMFSYPLTISGARASSVNLTHHIFFKGVASRTYGSRLVRTTVACASNLVGRFDTAINSSSSAALSNTVPSSSEVCRSLSGS